MPGNLIIIMVFREIGGILIPHRVKQTVTPYKNNKTPSLLVVYIHIALPPG